MQLLKFEHANHKNEVLIVAEQIAAYYFSPAQKCTMLVASGGAVVPVSETPSQVTEKLTTVTKLSVNET